MLKAELRKFTYNYVYIAFFAIVILLSIWISGNSYGGLWDVGQNGHFAAAQNKLQKFHDKYSDFIKIDVPENPEQVQSYLRSMEAILGALPNSIINTDPRTETFRSDISALTQQLNDSLNSLKNNPVAKGETVFVQCFGQGLFMLIVLSVLLTPLFLGMDFANRTVTDYISAGNSRDKVFVFKMIQCYILSLLAVLIYPTVCVLRYSLHWLGTLDASGWLYAVRAAASVKLLYLTIISVYCVITSIFRDFAKSAITCGIVLAAILALRGLLQDLSKSNAAVKAGMDAVGQYFNSIVARDTSTAFTLLNTVVLIVVIIGCGTACYIRLHRTDLK